MRRSGRFGTLVVAGAIVMAGTSVIASESAFGANGLKGQTRARWQGAIAQLPLPGKGCFTASYPTLAWRAIQCKVAPDVPFGPAVRNLSTPATPIATKPVGNGNDYAAEVTSPITEATGSFANVSPGITEKGPYGGSGPKIANTFSLQLNTQFFSGSPACSGSSKPSKCLAWQQFVYTTDSNSVFMQYWLIDYAAKCPSHWFTYETDCYTNSPASTFSGGALTAADLATAKLSGIATQGSTDAVELSNGVQVSSVDNPDSMLDLAPNWTTTEFGVFGDGGGGQAKFGKKTTLEAETALTSSSLAAPECVVEGFTGETNNLKLTGTPALGTEATPTMGSEQTNHDAKNASCVTAPG
jgi:hypothetical protein